MQGARRLPESKDAEFHRTLLCGDRLLLAPADDGRHGLLGKRTFGAEDLSALVLASLKADAEAFLGEPVTSAIITVPAYFNDRQRKATRRAGELAGFTGLKLLREM